MIDVLDYGVGNSGSVIRMIEKVGGLARLISTPDDLISSKKLIIPGVGPFDGGMSQIMGRGFLEPLREKVVNQGIPVLGICLGMQLLCINSEEGVLPGLGFVNAQVRKFSSSLDNRLKIPHMGWNEVKVIRDNPLLGLSENSRFYFAHSYYVEPHSSDMIIASMNYGFELCAAFQVENIFGVQFHPEKSHRFGMNLFRQFLNL